jgi:heparinase II/III-like protein
MSKLVWYWRRLAPMTAREAALHARKKLRQLADARGARDWPVPSLEFAGRFPRLPKPGDAPAVTREALRRDAERILSGRWRAFGHLELQVDTPPRWHKDYLAATDLATEKSAFKLNHRDLPHQADIKLIWELSRWHQLVRLAMAGYVHHDERCACQCLDWLDDWVKHNPPYRGWNWTSALEAGVRLIQFTWIDALVGAQAESNRASHRKDLRTRLRALRQEILPAHVWFTWRYKSFGSSANNHLIGELAGLILATARWPDLARCGTTLDELQRLWEDETLAQFAEDGGNREQALNYQLFSWELCWQARAALLGAGRTISPAVDERLRRAAQFYVDIQVPSDPWDYGDSDGAFVTPFFTDETEAVREWHLWLTDPVKSGALDFWWGAERPQLEACRNRTPASMPYLKHYKESGQGILCRGAWAVRLDVSPLGYLKTAAHGHLDALQLSLWHGGVAMVVDPGTGSYYWDKRLREWLASRPAHNAPCAEDNDWPRRFGPFLWATNHAPPDLGVEPEKLTAGFHLPRHVSERTFRPLGDASGFQVEDRCFSNGTSRPGVELRPFTVCWQFGPGATLERLTGHTFRVTRRGVSLDVEVSDDWAAVYPVAERNDHVLTAMADTELEAKFAGTVSCAFRKVEWAPFLKLVARPQPGRPCVFRTTFLASPQS